MNLNLDLDKLHSNNGKHDNSNSDQLTQIKNKIKSKYQKTESKEME